MPGFRQLMDIADLVVSGVARNVLLYVLLPCLAQRQMAFVVVGMQRDAKRANIPSGAVHQMMSGVRFST